METGTGRMSDDMTKSTGQRPSVEPYDGSVFSDWEFLLNLSGSFHDDEITPACRARLGRIASSLARASGDATGIQALEGRVAALREYCQHKFGCAWYTPSATDWHPHKCNCGLEALFAERSEAITQPHDPPTCPDCGGHASHLVHGAVRRCPASKLTQPDATPTPTRAPEDLKFADLGAMPPERLVDQYGAWEFAAGQEGSGGLVTPLYQRAKARAQILYAEIVNRLREPLPTPQKRVSGDWPTDIDVRAAGSRADVPEPEEPFWHDGTMPDPGAENDPELRDLETVCAYCGMPHWKPGVAKDCLCNRHIDRPGRHACHAACMDLTHSPSSGRT